MRGFVLTLTLLATLVMVACGEGEEGPTPTPSAPSPTESPDAGPIESPTQTEVAGSPTATATLVPLTPHGTPEASLPIGKIAFSSRRDMNGEIYLLTADDEVNLTNDPAEDIESDLSPDGTKIVFASDREEGVYHIFVMNADGTGVQKLTNDVAGDFSPRWSPDAERIAFSRAGAVMVMDSDGSNVEQITMPEREQTAAPCKAGGFLGGWSPDGEKITFYAASVSRSLGQVCIVNADGSDLTVVVSDPPGYHVEPAWSPDGEWIAYRSIRDDNNEINIVRIDGSDDTNLTNHPAWDAEPDWSPDGEWIVFSSDRSGSADLYMMRPDGTDVARLTTSGGKDSDPSWR